MVSLSDKSTDLDVKRRITNLLVQRNAAACRKIDIEVIGGTVILRGTVHSFYERQLCLACSQQVSGVLKLVDEIQVK